MRQSGMREHAGENGRHIRQVTPSTKMCCGSMAYLLTTVSSAGLGHKNIHKKTQDIRTNEQVNLPPEVPG